MPIARSSNRIEATYDHWAPLSDDAFELSMANFEEFCRHSLVPDKNGIPVVFELNEAQKKVADLVLSTMRPIIDKDPGIKFHPVEIQILIHKARQEGITTVFLKLEQFILSKVENFNALHIMPTEPEAEEMIDRKFIPLIEGTHPDLLADINSSGNRVDFIDLFGNRLSNRLRFVSANIQGAGHGRTIHMLVEDEYAKYRDPFTLESGILPAMSGSTIRIVIFTAKGMNHAYDLSKTAQDPESNWHYLFLPWYILSEYESEPRGKYKDLTGLTDYDVFLCQEFKRNGVPIEKWARKLQWYNDKFINEANRDTQYMFENYPTVASESFQASGSPIFDSTKLYKWMDTPFKRLDVFAHDGQTEFRYVEGGAIKELEPPIRGHSYLMGVDPADGEVQGDDSSIVIWDVTSDKIKAVCAYNGVISQDDLAEMCYDLANRYNYALIVPERNMGQLMIKWLTEVKGYTNIWTDAQKVTGYNSLGVRTTTATKNEMIARLKFLMNNGYYEDFDPAFCEEALYFTFQKTPSGQLKAAGDGGHHDDCVLSRMIATMALDMGRYKDYSEQIIKEGKKYG